MKKQFIYFFKHKNLPGIKIGRTAGESVNERFRQFKTYSPCGSEIIGFFECDNCVISERKIHSELKGHRMYGEFFDISVDHALAIIEKYDTSSRKIKLIFNEWIANPENNIEELQRLFIKAGEVKKNPIPTETKEYYEIEKRIVKGNTHLTSTEIASYLESFSDGLKYNINFIGAALKKQGFVRKTKKGIYGYMVEFKQSNK